jgi:hypothetical protein
MMMLKANQLSVGDEFTTQADQGEVWFRVAELKRSQRGLIDVHGVVVSHNPDVDYAVGNSEWMDLAIDEEVFTR